MKKHVGADLSTIVYDARIAAEAEKRHATKTQPITKNRALKIGAEFASLVREHIDSEAIIYVFGSTIKGEAKIDSDIDIAVISHLYGDDVMASYVALSLLAEHVNWDIEIHSVSPIDWIKGDPHVHEIKMWGIKI